MLISGDLNGSSLEFIVQEKKGHTFTMAFLYNMRMVYLIENNMWQGYKNQYSAIR